MAVNFNLPTVDTNYTAFPTQIIENIDAALQQLSVGSPSNVPTNAIKWDATANRWKKYNGSAYVDLTGDYNLNANLNVNRIDMGNNERLRLGNSQNLQVYHSGSEGFIDNTTGTLSLRGDDINVKTVSGTNRAKFGTNFELYESGNLTFKSVSNGCQIESGKSFNVDNGTLYVDPSNNRVGISTTSPSQKLEISEAGAAYLQVTNTSKSKDSKFGLLNDTNGTGAVQGNGIGFFGQDGNYDMYINTAGNVGIGTTNQGSNRLVVAGNQIITTHLEFYNTVSAKTAEAFISKSATNTLAFGTANSNRVFIDGDGKLGVGGSLVTSIDSLVQIQGTGASDDVPMITCRHTNSPSNNSICGGIEGCSGTNNIASMLIKRDSQGNTAGKLVFATQQDGQGSVDPRMTITSQGHVRINQDTSSTPGFNSNNNVAGVAIETANCIYVSRFNANSTMSLNTNSNGGQMITFRKDTGEEGSIRIQSDGSGIIIAGESDYRLKENIVDIDDGITRLKKLKPKRYNFIKAKENNPKSFVTYDGFLAHEVSEVCPEAVIGEKDAAEMQQLDASKLITVTVAALQELITRVETLESK
tara:strand:+ start:205 stop:1959 length:1755 start_codon:yes stop_codon:yes gene_type:complete